MKKIIALAVAGAFVAPVYAADVTISGEIESTYASSDGANNLSQGTQDITVTASETLDNGLSVTGFVRFDNANGTVTSDSAVTISGDFGSVQVGKEADLGGDSFDAKSEVASMGASASGEGADGELSDGISTSAAVVFMPNTGINGLSLALGFGSSATTATDEVTGYGAQYSAGGLTVAYGVLDSDSAAKESAKVLSLSYAMGPAYIGIDSLKNQGGAADHDVLNIGVTYTMGDITLELEQKTEEGTAAQPTYKETTDTVVGINYDLGAGLEIYAGMGTDETATSATVSSEVETTFVGVEYKF